MTRASDRTVTWLTVIIIGIWVFSIMVRLYRPEFVVGPALDASVLLAAGYWFSKQANKGDDK